LVGQYPFQLACKTADAETTEKFFDDIL